MSFSVFSSNEVFKSRMVDIDYEMLKRNRFRSKRRKIVSISIDSENAIEVINVHSFTIDLGSLFVRSKAFSASPADSIHHALRFLHGRCKNPSCPYSHEITPGKVPTCSYFIKGACGQDNCPYAHSYVGHDAKVCEEFLQGFCSRGTEVSVHLSGSCYSC